jgi:hypothetical protein
MAGMPEMQEQFSAGACMARNAETKEKFSAPHPPAGSTRDTLCSSLASREMKRRSTSDPCNHSGQPA